MSNPLPPSAWLDDRHDVIQSEALTELYGQPGDSSLAKVSDHIHPLYRPYIEASPFAVLATRGPQGLDTSPRGDAPGFIEVADVHTLLLPDRRGNNRIDSLRNLLNDPAVALLFLIPGSGETLRVNGTARISTAPALLAHFAVGSALPRSVLVISVRSVYFQCARAIMRSKLWPVDALTDLSRLPTAGDILGTLSQEAIDGAAYDAILRERQRGSLY
jgi:PPOX class probable FMN-dependent enzyme